jgi:hypothetical protein
VLTCVLLKHVVEISTASRDELKLWAVYERPSWIAERKPLYKDRLAWNNNVRRSYVGRFILADMSACNSLHLALIDLVLPNRLVYCYMDAFFAG